MVSAERKRPAFNPTHLPILERYGGKRGKQALALIAAGQMLWPVAQAIYERATARDDFTITVPGTDYIYPDLHEWVLERLPVERRRAMIATTATEHRKDDTAFSVLRLCYDRSTTHTVDISGHSVQVSVAREDVPARANLPENWRQSLENLTFTARDADGRDAVVAIIESLIRDINDAEKPPALHMPARFGGGWTQRGDLPPRTLTSVVLKDGQLERLTDDLQQFLDAEEEYNRLSQPWHRGYLFHGSPGTGKTSVARALANHFDLPTYYLPLGDIEKDADLTQLVAKIEPRSVLLLEDADVFHATTERDQERKTTSLAAMLNALDGVWTPHGLITVMTTNHKGALDDAILRPGRIDVDEEFTSLDREQAERLAVHFDFPPAQAREFAGQSPAMLIREIRQRKESPCASSPGLSPASRSTQSPSSCSTSASAPSLSASVAT